MNIRHGALSFLMAATLTAGPAVVIAQGPPPPPGYSHGDWENAPTEFQEAQRQGYHDGVEGARKDYENHRRPDVNNRDEYRHPHVRSEDRHDYREGFRRGYQAAVDHMMNSHN